MVSRQRYPGAVTLRLRVAAHRRVGAQQQQRALAGCHAGPAGWQTAAADRGKLHGRSAVGALPNRYWLLVCRSDDERTGRVSARRLALDRLRALRPWPDDGVVRRNRV